MKKLISFLSVFACIMLATACQALGLNFGGNSSSSSSSSSNNPPAHVHQTIKMQANDPSCSVEGNVEYYFCWSCSGYFTDAEATNQITPEQTRIPTIAHSGEKVEQVDATCDKTGTKAHWSCTVCSQKFLEEACTQAVSDNLLTIATIEHELSFYAGYPINGKEDGMKDYWQCSACEQYFLEEAATEAVEMEDIILYSIYNLPDFIVEVPAGRDPVILQLSDTQIIDGAQTRNTQSHGDRITYATENIKPYCYDYVEEIIRGTNPDLILLTGDIVYGKYDDNGTVLQAFIAFMESFQIPWAPVIGNHDAESFKGIDWQCQQFENANYCLFKQRTLTGNGNYSVGIMQNDVLTRVFFMLDSNGYSDASSQSLKNGHTRIVAGFGDDQIEWYTKKIEAIKTLSPNTKISFAYHIQQAVFADALAKYGFDQAQKEQGINLDLLTDKAEGDFGYIGRQMKTAWDTSMVVYTGMKRLGVDSIFVGHEHCNSASVVYEGIRFQYGQKSSQYDRYNAIDAENNVVAEQIWNQTGNKPLIGGSVVVLSETTGEIQDGYIYYCGFENGVLDWNDFS